MNADHKIIAIRHRIIAEVAKMAFEGTLEEELDLLPERMWPGPLPTHRCCVYREREITRQRIRLTLGKASDHRDNGNIIQVIDPACADCPVSGYLVADTCQSCVGKSCLSSCKFGAITAGKHHTEIDRFKCKECGQCAKACPYKAIVHIQRPCKSACPVNALTYDEFGLALIDEEKCIRCGHCIHSCPFGAIGTRNHIVPVIEAIKSGKHVYAMLAPATEGQFGPDITMASWKKAAKEVGFTDLIEVGVGADLTTASEAQEWREAFEKGEKKTTSCCPAFVNMIKKHYHEIADMVSNTVSPMCQLSRLIKSRDPEAITVFIGPCIAKKSEVIDHKIEGNADYALIYSEFEALMKAKDVKLTPVENNYQESSVFGKRFANAGGVAKSCLAYLKEEGFDEELSVHSVSGAEELKTALKELKKGDAPFQFVEGMFCEGGCFFGPSSFDTSAKAKRNRDLLIESADQRTIHENLLKIKEQR